MPVRIVAGKDAALLREIGSKSLADAPIRNFKAEAWKARGKDALITPYCFLERGDALSDSCVLDTEQAGNFAPGVARKSQCRNDAQ